MNGDWFPWSGIYYGGDEWGEERKNWVGTGKLQGRISPRGRSRAARGARISSGCFTRIIIPTRSIPGICTGLLSGPGLRRWVRPERLRAQFKDEPNPDIRSLCDWPYQEMCGLDPKNHHDRRMATGEFRMLSTSQESAARMIRQGLELFRTRYPRIKGAIYWHTLAESRSILQHLRVIRRRIFASLPATARKSGFVGQSDLACDSEKVESPNRLWRAAPSTYTS